MNKSPPHIVLGISPDASDTEIKKTYRRLAKEWHPDRYQGSKKYGEEQFKRIKDAKETMLSDEYKDKRDKSDLFFSPFHKVFSKKELNNGYYDLEDGIYREIE